MKTTFFAAILALLVSVTSRAETLYWFDNFETNATSHWTVNSPWSIGTPSSGPGSAYSGTHCGMTEGYSGTSDARLICTSYLGASTLTVPAADQYPRLRFWHWFNLANALGYVEISTNSGSGWIQISPTYTYQNNPTGGGVWSRPSLDLRPYAGKSIQIAFHFTSGGTSNGKGWYVDDVAVVTGTPIVNEQEGFESGQGDWAVDFGAWQVGTPANGPSAHSGHNCAAVGLDANFASYLSTRLISPPFTVPNVTSPTFGYWQWCDFKNAYGILEISTNGFNNWNYLTDEDLSDTNQTWVYETVDLSGYIGETIEIGFDFVSGGTVTGYGWFIDDISIPYTMPIIMVTASSAYAAQNGKDTGVFSISRSDNTNTAVTVNLAVGGTATAGTDYRALPTTITFDAGQMYTNLTLSVINAGITNAKTVVLSLVTNGAYFPGLTTNAAVTIIPNSSTSNSITSAVGRYWRGTGGDPTYWSLVVPLDTETGILYSNLSGNCSNLYSGLTAWSSQTLYHYNAASGLSQTNLTNRLSFNNPVVAFGERVGGSALYAGQMYSFGLYAGDLALSNQAVVIQAYYRTNFQLAGSVSLYPPTTASASAWTNFAAHGFQMTTNAYGLTTVLFGGPDITWGQNSAGGYQLSHTATGQATNYYYVVAAGGYPADGSIPMVVNGSNQIASSPLYSLEFETRPAWRAVVLDQPNFNGSPLPPYYAGETLAELLTNTWVVTNVVSLSPTQALSLDNSPELRRHPILDNFVASMGNDPIALANYVINQIGLTDPIDYNDDGNVAEDSVNPGGVTRGALGTFLEKQGSPVEQCALLVYLLRQAGVPAVYEFAPHNGLQILDARLSEMLKFQVQSNANYAGQLYTTNTMIPVNYPWVAAYIGTNWVHIFPWLKDYQLVEGFNLWEEMPTNYSTASAWVHDYLYGNSNLLSLAEDDDDTPRVIFPAYVKQTLLQNDPDLSVDDIGVDVINRQHYFARWQDFPTPTWLTNVSTAITNLASTAITNVNPSLTNIFDTLSVEVYSLNNESKDLKTGDLRLCDLHNREFYIYQSMSGTNVQLSLILAPFRTNVTTTAAFTNDANLLSKEVQTMTFGPTDYQLGVRFKYHRHRAITPAYAIDPNIVYMGDNGFDEIDFERPLFVGDQAAICLNFGQVTHEMLDVHAADLWQMENTVDASPSKAGSVSADVYEGAVMYLAGMSYYEKCGEFDRFNQNIQKFVSLSSFAAGLSKIVPGRNSSGALTNGIDPILPCVDMFFYTTMLVGNGTIHPGSGQNYATTTDNYLYLSIADLSAEEHQAINRFYQQTNAVSTVRLLQLAQSSGAGIVPLNYLNYIAAGSVSYQGKALANWDSGVWQEITNVFNGNYGSKVLAFITPGPMTNAAYRGMGAFILSLDMGEALISPNSINGGFASETLPPATVAAANTPNYDLIAETGDYSIGLTAPTIDSGVFSGDTANSGVSTTIADITAGDEVITPTETTACINAAQALGITTDSSDATYALVYAAGLDAGFISGSMIGDEHYELMGDPVNNITGEFYVDETDLTLPGPIPLALRRNYSSENQANNQFGFGWKLSIMPYLCLSMGSTNIYAADMDGAVLAYVHSTSNTNLWTPTLAANPELNNNTTAGVGGLVNRLRDTIVRSFNGSITNYTLYGADGSVRVFQFMKFNSGTSTNARPYLTRWTDNRGNFYTFSYDTNAADSNFGQMERIQCSNGNFLGFDYDIYGHMIDAYSGDGRWVYYDYDDYGDLVTVTLPDDTTRSYQYLHGTQAITNGSAYYSTHLISEEDKPDGRAILNAYDSQRRVTNQLSTAGSDLNPIRTATFIYSNNFVLTNSFTNPISGTTWAIDGNNHTNRYDYTKNLITLITDPLGQTIHQTWYADTATAPGYPRSLSQMVDKRGMITQFQYDGNGNVTNKITCGDLTGDGIVTQTATNTAVYNTNSLPLQMTDPVGNSLAIIYDPVFNFLPQQSIRYAGATPVSTDYTFYGNTTNVVVNGSLTRTNLAFGLPIRQISAYGSADAATNDTFYNGNGFPAETIAYTGTGDPNITNTFFYNERGQMVDRVDALGAVTFYDYDAMNRPIEQENFDESSNVLAWKLIYYTDNGEVNWSEGPRYNPENYEFYDYDGAGRCTTHVHWRSEANSAGTGVEEPAGYNLYAQSFYEYDVLGNLTLAVDPRGAMTTNWYDPLCRLVQRQHLDTNGVTVLSTERFGYEPGGQVQYYTNALGGVTTTLYTAAGKPEFRSNPDGSTNAWRYYLDGRINKEVQGNGAFWQTTYDDVDRITTRIFYSAAGLAEATNSVQLDRRGNPILSVDAGGNAFTTSYDGLNRPKASVGPAITTVTTVVVGNPPSSETFQTNTLQQAVTNFYDAAGRVLTNINALGETTVTRRDALGRITANQLYSASGTLVHQQYRTYSADHNSVTVTDGFGADAITHTDWTDTDGHTVLAIASPSANTNEFVVNQYDLAGNLVSAQHDSSANGTVTPWTTATSAYDGLNRVTSRSDRDNALTAYAYDGVGDVTNCTVPGGVQWQAIYNPAGQIKQMQESSGGATTRTTTYNYYAATSPFAGHLQTKTDGRGVTSTYIYDDWLRPTNIASSGSLPEQNLTTTMQYEPRGFLDSITEQFATTNTGPVTTIQRSFDPYGQLASESLSDTAFGYTANQNWDAAGRRTQVSLGDNTYGFGWQADGALIAVSDSTGNGGYNYTTSGILTNRIVGNRQTSTTALDGEGRPLSISTTVNLMSQLTESMAWSGDGLLATHTLNRGDFGLDNRLYTYATASRRLTQEQLNLNSATTWTNTFSYDGGTASGPGVLTTAGQLGGGTASWNGGTDAFSRINTATNSLIPYTAFGHVNGQSILSAWLDSLPVSVTGEGTNAMQWRASMELAPGAHQLLVAAAHPSGRYIAWATNSFTNSLANETANDTFDGAGNITNRVWRNPSGAVERTQTLSWDARGRLHAVTERDAKTNGYNWTATYDGLGRRLTTTSVIVTNGVAYSVSPSTIDSYYDPQVEFLELGVSYGTTTEWKLYGPDVNGKYGALNGTGGLEAVSPYLNLFEPVISDFRGNVLAVESNSIVQWNPARPTGYGAVPNYRPVALGSGASVSLSSAWRGKWADVTSYIQVGARTYDPVAGRWLSFDPSWNGNDVNGMSFCGGDPINYFDHDGRLSRLDYEAQNLGQDYDVLSGGYSQNYSPYDFYNQSSDFKNVLGTLFPGQSYGDLDEAQRLSAIGLISGGSSQGSGFSDAAASANYYSQMSANGLNSGGIGGYAEAAAGQAGEDLLDFFGTTSVQQSAQQSGYASADPNRQGAAWGYGALTIGSIAMNAIPGEGKVAAEVEEEGVKLLTAKAADTGAIRNVNLAGQNHPVTGIPFNSSGFPDFSSVAIETVQIDYTGTRAGDFAAANEAAGLASTPEGYTWHHVEDGTTMQLVPTDIHRATGHTGGFSMYPTQ